MFEIGQDAAEIASIKTQFAAQGGSGHLITVSDFKQDTGFGQGVGAVEEAFTQNADLTSEKAIEVPDNANPLF